MKIELAFTPEICKLCHTELKDNFEEAHTMANYSIEIERNNVTLAQFLRYVRQQCEKKGIYFEIDRETFEKPLSESSYRYSVINGAKK